MAQTLPDSCKVFTKGSLLDPLMPSLSSGLPLVTPPKALSTMNAEILSFFTPSTSTSDLANTVMMSAIPPFEIQNWRRTSKDTEVSWKQRRSLGKASAKMTENDSSHLGAADQIMLSIFRQGRSGLNGGCITSTVMARLKVSEAKAAISCWDQSVNYRQ